MTTHVSNYSLAYILDHRLGRVQYLFDASPLWSVHSHAALEATAR